MDFLKALKTSAGYIIYNRGVYYYENNEVIDCDIYHESSIFNDKMISSIIGEVQGNNGNSYSVEISYNEDGIVDEFCTCLYFEENHKTCKHIIALALEAHHSILGENPVLNYHIDTYLDFLKKPLPEKNNLLFLNIVPTCKDIFGYPELKFDMEIVSKEKNYKLNNKLLDFLQAYENYSFNFGKFLTYDPLTDYFQGWERKFLNLLKEYLETIENFHYDEKDFEDIFKNKFTFDRIMDIFHEGKQIELKKVSLKDLLDIDLKKIENNSIEITFKNLERYFIRGEQTLVNMHSTLSPIFYRVSKSDMDLLKRIFQKTSRSNTMIISEKNLSQIIGPIQKMGRLNISKNLKDKIFTPEKIEEKIYIDSYNTFGLKIYSKLFFDGKSQDELTDSIILNNNLTEDSLYKNTLKKYCTNFEDNIYYITNVEDIYNFVMEGIPLIDKKYEIYYSEEFKNKKYLSTNYQIQTKVNDLLEISFSIDGISKEEIIDFLKTIREKKKYYLLKNGGIISIPDSQELDKLNDLLDISEASKKEIESGLITRAKNYSYFLNSTLKNIKNIVLDDEFKKINKTLNNLHKKKDLEEIKENFPMLRDYQLYGVQWLLTLKKLGLGGILADDMGLGKTLQTIAYLFFEKRKFPSIVVAPKSLVYNWKSEFEKFAPNIDVKICVGTKNERENIVKGLKSKDVLITTYGFLKNDMELYKEMEFANIIIDEAQNIKNILGKTSNAIKNINGETKIALTGTPIENNILELWSIFDFAFPGYLGKHTTFKKRYIENLKNLKEIVSPFILRRTKDEVLKELPKKIEQNIVVELTDKQKKVYLSYLEKYKNEIAADKSDTIKILSYLMRLRQICNHPKLFLDDYKGDSAKLDALLEILEEAKSGGHRVLLFSQFTEMLEVIKENLANKFNVLYLDGKVKIDKRAELVERFNSGDGDIFIISLKAGGSGLNLTGADTVIHFDPWWNPSVENQATDRAHRIGQKNTVNVFKFITKGTIEEKIDLIKGEKSKIISEILDGNNKDLLKMNKNELLTLF